MQTGHKYPNYFTVDSSPWGVSFGHWTVRWWRWALNIPTSKNPLVDQTGDNAYVNQRKDVWFLAGKPADCQHTVPNRQCNVPAGTSILFPIINCEANKLEYPELDKNGLIDNVINHMELIRRKECIIDGNMVPVQHIPSDPEIFQIQINSENIFGIPKGGSTIASADGYWVFLKPLELGEHVIKFYGSCSAGARFSGSKYVLNVY